jgi:hypothetical protein
MMRYAGSRLSRTSLPLELTAETRGHRHTVGHSCQEPVATETPTAETREELSSSGERALRTGLHAAAWTLEQLRLSCCSDHPQLPAAPLTPPLQCLYD